MERRWGGGGGGGGRIDRNGIEDRFTAVFQSFVKKQCLKVMKIRQWALPGCVWQSVMNQASLCGRSVHYIMRQLFLLFTSRGQTNMVAPWGIQIKSVERKKEVAQSTILIDFTTTWSLQTEICALFLHFQEEDSVCSSHFVFRRLPYKYIFLWLLYSV